MRLQSGERSLLAYYVDRKDAERGLNAIREAGFDAARLDEISETPGDGPRKRLNPLTGDVESLGELTLGADADSRSEGVLQAAHPDASGLADVDAVQPTWLLTVVAAEERAQEAEQILR